MVIAAKQLLGMGLYSPSQAALYARVSTQLMTRWLWGTRTAASVLRPQLESQEQTVTFLDFVQALAVRAIRLQHRVPLQKIREAIEKAAGDYNESYPFARKHKTFLFGNEVIIKLAEDDYVQITGKNRDNRMLTPVVELYMRDLTFDRSGLAAAYEAFAWKDLAIVMDPTRRMGEPLVKSCGYSATALWEAAVSEGSFEATAEAYGVTVEEVEMACRYHDHLLGKTAA